ncbi:cytokinin riboside 5'-monophosphate phosphoribohydrolase [Marivirga lumbricoides]|uniref:Cytokinin riboside 5'-monophosphate phosphoribohydrolase n=2 Tax=Marivirga lumbricoides TaxID=1046115 RepID=A0ABQ1MDD9_9BACT|nr:cytokinin riboside 5'-monophosphate phosphoribohydrolase [Marivirga lumbricoides]
MIKSVAVFCGSSAGNDPMYYAEAYKLGRILAKNEIRLIYGGARVGLMGAVADGALSLGGKVIGVLPHFLSGKEIAHADLTELIIVDTMHERKLKMHDLSDGFIALPGGFGTLEELFEILTWGQLGLHQHPVAILNCNGFYDFLQQQLATMVSNGLLKEENAEMVLMSTSIEDILEKMNGYKAPATPKWITKDKT